MKRFFAAFLALACILSLSACREEQAAAKPVIYLYPEKETTVTVKLDYAGTLTCTYPCLRRRLDSDRLSGRDSDRRCRTDLQLSLLGGRGYHRV